MDEEKASVEDLMRRGEELLQQTSDESQKEELRLLLLRLQSQYSAHRVRCIKHVVSSLSLAHIGMFFFCLGNQSSMSCVLCVFLRVLKSKPYLYVSAYFRS